MLRESKSGAILLDFVLRYVSEHNKQYQSCIKPSSLFSIKWAATSSSLINEYGNATHCD